MPLKKTVPPSAFRREGDAGAEIRPPTPRTLSQLIDYLKRWPRVRIHASGFPLSEFRFVRISRGVFHFWEDVPRTSRPAELPLYPNGDDLAWSIDFDANGFSVSNDHGRTRVEYLF